MASNAVTVLVCQDNRQPRVQQPILRFAPAEAAIEARPPRRVVQQLSDHQKAAVCITSKSSDVVVP